MGVSGRLDLNTESEFLQQVRTETAPVVILDLSGVSHIDSRRVAALVQIYTAFELERRRLALVGLSERVKHVLKITQVLRLFKVFATLTEAEEALA